MDEIEPTPLQWLKETWASDPLEVILPAAWGALLAQGLTAALVLRSPNHILLALALMALGISLSRSAGFFLKLSRERTAALTPRELQSLFVPLVAAIAIYGMIAPNFALGAIFALMSLPHLALLMYAGKRYTTLAPLPQGSRLEAGVARLEALYVRGRALAERTLPTWSTLRLRRHKRLTS